MLCMCIHYINCTQKKVMYGGEPFFQIQSWPDYRFIATSWVGIYALPRLCHVIKIQKRDNKRDWRLWNELPWQKYWKPNLEKRKRETNRLTTGSCETSYHDPGPPTIMAALWSIYPDQRPHHQKSSNLLKLDFRPMCFFNFLMCLTPFRSYALHERRVVTPGAWDYKTRERERGGVYNGIRLEEW